MEERECATYIKTTGIEEGKDGNVSYFHCCRGGVQSKSKGTGKRRPKMSGKNVKMHIIYHMTYKNHVQSV